MALTWDPERYLTYADERGRPFVELLARVGAAAPAEVVDLGCGPGNLTALLAERWPEAHVVGVDSSPEMIAAAQAGQREQAGGPGVSYVVSDLRAWRAGATSISGGPVDVLISNATLQWVPGHLGLLTAPDGLLDQVAPGGWLALQVPGNFDQPSHVLRAELAAEAPYADALVEALDGRELATPASHDPVDYSDALTGAGCTVDAWETEYLHVLRGPDPVFTWVTGTGARPTLEALGRVSPQLRAGFEEEFRRRLAAAYPVREDGTVVLPFRRVFAVARRAGVAR